MAVCAEHQPDGRRVRLRPQAARTCQRLEGSAITRLDTGQEVVEPAGHAPRLEAIARFDAGLRELYQSLRSLFMKELAARKLSYSASLVLFMVNRRGKATMGELQRELGLANSTITGLVDTLHGRGLVERYPDPQDRRVVYVQPTPEGAAEVASLRQKRVEWLASTWPAGSTLEELEAALRLLEKLTFSLASIKTWGEPDQ